MSRPTKSSGLSNWFTETLTRGTWFCMTISTIPNIQEKEREEFLSNLRSYRTHLESTYKTLQSRTDDLSQAITGELKTEIEKISRILQSNNFHDYSVNFKVWADFVSLMETLKVDKKSLEEKAKEIFRSPIPSSSGSSLQSLSLKLGHLDASSLECLVSAFLELVDNMVSNIKETETEESIPLRDDKLKATFEIFQKQVLDLMKPVPKQENKDVPLKIDSKLKTHKKRTESAQLPPPAAKKIKPK